MSRVPDPGIQRALAFLKSGRPAEAIPELRRLLQRDPDNPNLHQMIGQALLITGNPHASIFHFERAVPHYPNIPSLLNNYANALVQTRRYGEAITMWERCIQLQPTYGAAYLGLCMAHAQSKNYTEAIKFGLRAIEIAPQIAEAHQNTALAYLESGRPHDAMRVLINGNAKCPKSTTLHSTLLISQNYVSHDRAANFTLHKRFGASYVAGPDITPAKTDPNPDRPLRVGVLSSDFHTHSVAFFFESLLLLRDRDQWQMHLYAVDYHPDDPTRARLRSNADAYTDLLRVSNAAIDQRIRADKIDILLELNGHSAGSRLAALVGKPAPVIITAIGYPNTTGVPAIDYRIVDSFTDPPGAEAFASERLIRLDPCFLCYRPPETAPLPSPPPSAVSPDTPITFGSFNALHKLSDDAIRLWSSVLLAVPGSGLILKGLGLRDPSVLEIMRDRFAACGVDRSRVSGLTPLPTTAEHLALYSKVDIALDVTPYHGTTTTCEALWMGVPVVSLIGQTHAARVGLSLLNSIGHREWAVDSAADFVRVAKELASDRAKLATIRATLREEVRSSPLCDAPAYSQRFYSALRQCWQEWCATQHIGQEKP